MRKQRRRIFNKQLNNNAFRMWFTKFVFDGFAKNGFKNIGLMQIPDDPIQSYES